MENKIQLLHPNDKKAGRMDKDKYDAIKKGIITILSSSAGITHNELLRLLEAHFEKEQLVFEGSLQWYMEWVKLDLEARKMLRRNKEKTTITFSLA